MPRPLYTPASRPNLYLPDGWDTGWKVARAAAASTPAVVTQIGDSISVGVTVGYANSFANQLLTYLQGLYGTYADYYTAAEGYLGPNSISWTAGQNGASLTLYNDGFGNCVYSSSLVANYVQRFTTPYACTAFDFLYYDDASYKGLFKYSLDGGAGVSIGNAGDNKLHRVSFTSLANATHTLDWGWQTSNANCFAQGCLTYRPGATGGLVAVHMAASGASMNYVIPSGHTGLASTGITGYPTGADLAIIAMSANDVNSYVAASYTADNFTQLTDQTIRALRRAKPNCSILLVATSYPNSTVDDVSSGFSNQNQAPLFISALDRMARVHGCAFANIHARWGSTPFAQGFLPNNGLHPLTAGHTDICNWLKPLV